MTKLTIKEKIFLIAAVFLFIALGALYHYKQQVESKYAALAQANDSTTRTLKTYYDANGQLHTQVEIMQVDRTLYTESNKHYMDSFAKSLGVKVNDIGSIVNASTRDTGRIHSRIDTLYIKNTNPEKKQDDTDVIYKVGYHQNGLDFDGTIDGPNFDATYSISDTMTFVTYQKGTGFLGLGKKKTYLNGSSSNKSIMFNNLRDVELTNIKDKRWSVGPSLQYNLFSNKIDVGVSLQYSLFKF